MTVKATPAPRLEELWTIMAILPNGQRAAWKTFKPIIIHMYLSAWVLTLQQQQPQQ